MKFQYTEEDDYCLTQAKCEKFQSLPIPNEYLGLKAHIAKIKIDQNRKTHLQILDMWCKNVRKKCRDSKKIFCTMSFFVNPG